MQIGARTNVQDGTIIHVSHHSPFNKAGYPTVIGDDVTVGHGTILHACTIEDLCLIGMGACVLDGATVKRYGFVGAGAVVGPGKVVGEAELWLGNPARLARTLSDKEIESLHYSAQHYVRLKDHTWAPPPAEPQHRQCAWRVRDGTGRVRGYGCVACSSAVSMASAWARDAPHMSWDGRRLVQTAGRVGRPNRLQRPCPSSCTHGTPAGLPCGMPGMAELMEGAIQQAAQPARQGMSMCMPQCKPPPPPSSGGDTR